MAFEAYEALGVDKVQHSNNSSAEHGDCGSPCGTGDTPTESTDEESVEENIKYRTSGHNPHTFCWVAAGAYEASEVEGHSGKEHAGKNNLHVLASIAYGVK